MTSPQVSVELVSVLEMPMSANRWVALIELYGFGGEKALEAQRAAREEKEEIVSSRRQVDKKQFIQSDFDKEFLFGGTFKASNEKQER